MGVAIEFWAISVRERGRMLSESPPGGQVWWARFPGGSLSFLEKGLQCPSRCLGCVSSGNAGLRPEARGTGVEFFVRGLLLPQPRLLVGEVPV